MYAKYAEFRDALNLTDYKVAEKTGISRSTLSDWKNGISTPKADKMLKIAELLKIPVETLIRKEE